MRRLSNMLRLHEQRRDKTQVRVFEAKVTNLKSTIQKLEKRLEAIVNAKSEETKNTKPKSEETKGDQT